jgi:hypothetical protein
MIEAAEVRPTLGEQFGQNALTSFAENTLLDSQLRAMAMGPNARKDELPKTGGHRGRCDWIHGHRPRGERME